MNEILIADGRAGWDFAGRTSTSLGTGVTGRRRRRPCLHRGDARLGGTARPLLLEISGVTLSNAARAAFAHAQPASAVAMLGSSVVDTVMGAALSRHDHCPHAYFTSEAEALAWLDSLAADPAGDAH